MNTSPIKLRRDPEFCSSYHVRSGLRIRDLPEGFTVQSEIWLMREGYWVDTHTVYGPDGQKIGYGDSLSDDWTYPTLRELRAAMEFYGLVWHNGHLRVGDASDIL